jgi:thiol-disulfide isomerase/thioredoxin
MAGSEMKQQPRQPGHSAAPQASVASRDSAASQAAAASPPAAAASATAPSPSTAPSSAGAAATAAALPPAVGRQARAAVGLVTLLGLAVLVWPRGGGTSLAAPGGFLLDPAGRAATLGSRLQPVTLVHFWATWCPPCIEETPALERLARDFAGNRDFGVVRVAVADSRSRVDAFLGAHAGGVLYDPQWDVAHRYGTEQLPETYLVVRGRIVEKFIGEVDWDDPAVRQKIAARLAAVSSAGGAAGMAGSS